MERSWNCQDSGTDITNKNVIHYHTIVILPQSDFDFSWAAQCSLLRVLKWAFLIMVIIGIFWISIKSRNLFVVFVESMKKHKKDRSQRSAKLLSKISKGFAVFVAMSINVLWFDFFVEILTYERSLFFSCRSRRIHFLQFVWVSFMLNIFIMFLVTVSEKRSILTLRASV